MSLLETKRLTQILNQAHFKRPGDGIAFDWHQDIEHRDKAAALGRISVSEAVTCKRFWSSIQWMKQAVQSNSFLAASTGEESGSLVGTMQLRASVPLH